MRNTAIDRIPNPSLSLISDRDHGLAPLVQRHVQQQLGRVAGPEHLVNGGEARRAVLVAEVGSENAVGGALPPQELASAAR